MSSMEELWAGSSIVSLPAQLLMSKIMLHMLEVVEFEVAGTTNSLASRPSSLPPFSHKQEEHCII